MNAYTVVGHAYRADTYCVGHPPARGCKDRECRDTECCPQPIFAGDEDWASNICGEPHGTDPLLFETFGDWWGVTEDEDAGQ